MKAPLSLLFLLLFIATVQSNAQKAPVKIGVNTSYSNDSVLAAAGYEYIEESTQKLFTGSDSAFRSQLAAVKKTKLPVKVTNVFFPGSIKLTGPNVNEAVVLNYVDSVMKRAKIAGVKIIVLGSSGSRKLPEGFSREEAIRQFVDIGRKMAVVAKKHDVVIAMENLNTLEDNFITTLAFANNIVNQIGHPNFKLTADMYHMLMEYEPAEEIVKAAKNLVHCHIAERENRAAPGVNKENFRPYFEALKKIGYKGMISLECRWDNMRAQAKPAHDYLLGQLNEAYNIKP